MAGYVSQVSKGDILTPKGKVTPSGQSGPILENQDYRVWKINYYGPESRYVELELLDGTPVKGEFDPFKFIIKS